MIELDIWVRKVLALEPEGWAIEFRERQIARRELDAAARRIVDALDAADVPQGGRVALMLRNRPGLIAALLACLSSRRTMVSISPFHPPEALAGEVAGVAADALLADPDDLRPEVMAAAQKAGTAVLACDIDAVELRLAGGARPAAPAARDANYIALQMLSSGTTGKPKRIDLRMRTLADAMRDGMVRPEDKAGDPRPKSSPTVVAVPLLHVSGLFGALMSILEARPIVLLERFEVGPWVAAIKRFGIKSASLAPTPMRMLLDANPPREDLASLIAVRTGTAPLPPATQKEFQDRYGVAVLVIYGASEWMGGIAGWTLEDHKRYGAAKLGSVGRARGDMRLRVVDPETGAELPAGEVGLLEIMPVGRVVEDRTWTRTTDRASLDADGFLYIHGRADDMILRGGFKVDAAKVADVLAQHPAVGEAAVLGFADRRLGEVPVAAVETRPGHAAPAAEELAAFARERLLPYQVPVHFEVMAALPRTVSMKVSRPELRAMLERVLEKA